VTGGDRGRFLNGQVTNNVKELKVGQGCYAALVTAKGRLESDLNIYCLPDELLLDFEPGLSAALAGRFEKFIIADDVQVVDVAPHYGLLSVQGPAAARAVARLGLGWELPKAPMAFATTQEASLGELYAMNTHAGPRPGSIFLSQRPRWPRWRRSVGGSRGGRRPGLRLAGPGDGPHRSGVAAFWL